MIKKSKLTLYNDGAEARIHNRRLLMSEDQETKDVVLRFQFATDDAESPACSHETFRGKVRQTTIKMSEDAIKALIAMYMEYKKSKR
jgi:hypothetical protein